jgi:hypothetical protein
MTRFPLALFAEDVADVPPVTPVMEDVTLADSDACEQRVRAYDRMRSWLVASKSLKFVEA